MVDGQHRNVRCISQNNVKRVQTESSGEYNGSFFQACILRRAIKITFMMAYLTDSFHTQKVK